MNFYDYLFHFREAGSGRYYVKTFSDFFSFFIFIIPSVFFFDQRNKAF